MNSMKRLWEARDEFLVRNIRFSKWNVVFLFAAGVIAGILRSGAIVGYEPAFGPFAIGAAGYGAGIFAFAFLPYSYILNTGRAGAVLALATLIGGAAAPQPAQGLLYSFGSFGNGLCVGIALYAFFYMLNNTERFFNMAIIGICFAIFIPGSLGGGAGRLLFAGAPVYILAAFLAAALFSVRQGDGDDKPAQGHEGAEGDGRTDGLGLTPREKQIFTMMQTEMSVKQIMTELEISRGTFNFHTANLYRKLGIQSRTELFAKYSAKD